MSERGASDERLREALRARSGVSRAAGECPVADELWELARGRLTARKARAIGAHVTVCGECREAMRLARELGASVDLELVSSTARARPALRVAAWAWAAAAAVVVIGIVGIVLRELPPGSSREAPVFREEPVVVIDAEKPHIDARVGEPVVLRWTPAPGARYDVTLAREDLAVLSVARGLTTAEYTVPPEVLARLQAGESLIWQVEAALEDGRRVRSATYSVRLE